MLKKLTTAIANYYYFLKGKIIPSHISNGKDIPIIINNFQPVDNTHPIDGQSDFKRIYAYLYIG